MNVFGDDDFSFSRIDVRAIVEGHGLAVIDAHRRTVCLDWLIKRGYAIKTIDCAQGFLAVLRSLGKIFSWEEQFGYRLEDGHAVLDAIKDGFGYWPENHRAIVIQWLKPEVLWNDRPEWFAGLLEISSEQTIQMLANSKLYFSLLVVEQGSQLLGKQFGTLKIPGIFWDSSEKAHDFS